MTVQSPPLVGPTTGSGDDTRDHLGAIQVDTLIDPYIADALQSLDGRAPLLAGMVRYHLGIVEPDFSPATPLTRAQSRGKRLRPAIALLSCEASGGPAAAAAPIAAALEMLHNFTLIHDDIQDKSDTRRHRETVWHLWGVEQAINAGDALFAVAHLPIVRLMTLGVPGTVVVRLIEAFNRMTIEIVEGQVLDLSFEGRSDVTPDAYIDMISGKTAAIVRYAAWAGAILGNAPDDAAAEFGAFGLALGLGYQIRDDALGVWGAPDVTGKATADDIRRRKQSLPIVLLRDAATSDETSTLAALYLHDPIDETGVATVLSMLDAHDVTSEIERLVNRYHDDARASLATAIGAQSTPAGRALLRIIDQLGDRHF